MKNLPVFAAIILVSIVAAVGAAGLTARLVLGQISAANAEVKTHLSEAGLPEGGKAVSFKPFVTNLGDADRPRYINVTVELIAKNEKDGLRIEQNTPLVRDAILAILNTQVSTEVSGEAGASHLKAEIQERINSLMGGSVVQRVLITDMVIQF